MWAQRNVFGYAIVGILTLALLSGAVATPTISAGASGWRKSLESYPLRHQSNLRIPNAVESRSLGSRFGKAPLAFEANQGQTDPSVKFLARGPGYQLYLTSTEAVLSLAPGADDANEQTKGLLHSDAQRFSPTNVIRMKLLRSRTDARVSGADMLPGKVNYLSGNAAGSWRRNVTTYKKVRYENVYQGIDLVYYGNQRELEYDFHLAPGADPGVIRIALDGVKQTEIDATGDLIMRLSSGEAIRQHKPVLYQEVDGTRREVTGCFVLRGPNEVGFEVGAYDKTRALVIDPVLVYATYFGGDGQEASSGIAVDGTGVYVTGAFVTSPGFPITPNAFQKTQNNTNGNGEIFITKFSLDGENIIYSTLLGGSSTDISTGIALDTGGNVHVVGWTVSPDFPVRNAFQSTLRGFPNAFITKLNSTGSDLLYSSFLGGTGNFDYGTDIAVDGSGNAYITGDTGSINFPVTPGAFRTTHVRLIEPTGDQDGFVAKFNTNASGAASLVYSTFCDVRAPYSNSLDVDPAGNVYVTGDALVEKISATGSALLYRFMIPHSSANNAGLHSTGIAVDALGQAYITGYSDAPGLPIVNGFQPVKDDSFLDGFLVKLSATGNAILYSTYIGGEFFDIASAVAVDGAGNAYVVGDTSSVSFPRRDEFQNLLVGASDIFIMKIDTNAVGQNSLIFSSYYGATVSDEAASGVALDADRNIYVTGFPFIGIVTGIIHTGRNLQADGTRVPGDDRRFDPFILKIANTSPSLIHFSSERFSASEGAGSIEVTVMRSGDTSAAANVDFATVDRLELARTDYTSAYGTLRFAPGETTKTFRVLITDDTSNEINETLYVLLREKTQGAALASPSVAELTIIDNDPADSAINPIDKRQFFVRQHYLDFLNREPDTEGFNFWVGQISPACDGLPFDLGCVEQRVNVSGAFFLAIESLETGYFVYRLHKASFGALPRFTPFLRDTQETGRDVVVGRAGWENQLEQNKQRLLADWVEENDFKARYDAMSNEQYVDALNVNTGNSLTTAERNALVAGLNGGTLTRADVLRRIAENEEFSRKEFSPAFVLMQYFGYLRRDPDAAGYQFWLNKLNEFKGDFRRAEMVKAFITSSEYRSRFGLD